MASFDIAFNRTNVAEGFYSNDSDDSGGETIYGIARKKNLGWRGWEIVDLSRDEPNFPDCLRYNSRLQEFRRIFYRQKIWNVIQGDHINSQAKANDIYDMAVNSGCSTSIKIAQRTLKMPETGIMDDPTLKRLNA